MLQGYLVHLTLQGPSTENADPSTPLRYHVAQQFPLGNGHFLNLQPTRTNPLNPS